MAAIGFAHRGARAHAPENTLEAFALALEMGARGLESDVWLTADGIAVLDHDGVFDGCPIAELPRAALPGHVPELADLYRECGDAFELSLDVKDAAAAEATLAVAGRAGALDRLWLCHWNWKVVAEWRALSGEVKLVDSTGRAVMSTPPAERGRRMRRLGIDALNLHHSDWSAEWIESIRAHECACFAWDLQDADDLRGALALGVDGIYSDWVDRMQAALGEHANSA